jgi:hypothetical protein
MDNSFSRFTSKLVYLYIISWAEDEWANHAMEIADFAVSVENVTVRLFCCLNYAICVLLAH